MKKILSLAILLLVLVSTGFAQTEDSHTLKTKELLSLMDMEKFMSQTLDTMMESQIRMNPAMEQFRDVFKKFFSKHFSWKSLEEEFVKLYKEEFTEDEIIELIKFYKTDIGRKTIKKLPLLMQKGSQLGEKRVMENIQELEQMIMEKMSEGSQEEK